MIEKALPQANVFCIEPASEGIIYKTDRADYTTDDFLGFDWPSLGSALASTLVFFDDHQDVFPRLKLCRNLGIKAVILDDNYPEYSGNRHVSMAAILNQKQNDGMFQYPIERKFLLENVESYHMFPPIFDFSDSVTMEKSFITIPSIHGQFNSALHSELSTYWQDAASYRWTTLVRFK
jgi:hypothetical protein